MQGINSEVCVKETLTPIASAILELSAEIDRLEGSIGKLTSKAQPVLGSEKENVKSQEAAPYQGDSELLANIIGVTACLSERVDELNALTHRFEI